MMPMFFKCIHRRMSCAGILEVSVFQGEYLPIEATIVTIGYRSLEMQQDPVVLPPCPQPAFCL